MENFQFFRRVKSSFSGRVSFLSSYPITPNFSQLPPRCLDMLFDTTQVIFQRLQVILKHIDASLQLHPIFMKIWKFFKNVKFSNFLSRQKSIFLTSMSSKITSHAFESVLNMFCKINECYQIHGKLNLDTQIALCDHQGKSANSAISRVFKSTSVICGVFFDC